jgi:sulfide:quinone oxidoreductase
MSDAITEHHRVLIVGGGTAGLSVAARLRRAGTEGVAVLEPSPQHYYQPLWTLVGGGRADVRKSVRPQADVVPKGVAWIQDAAVEADPERQTVTTATGRVIGYDFLVLAAGVQLDFDKVPGLGETLGLRGVSSNYRYDLAPRTWEFIKAMDNGGHAVFTMPPGPVKCAGAPQKIAYLAASWWRKQGLLDRTRMTLLLPTQAMFSQPDWARVLTGIAADYGIEVRKEAQLVEVDPGSKQAIIADTKEGTKEQVAYDFMHVTPPQSAPDWIKASPFADPESPFGYVKVDKHTLQTPYPNVFALGDVANVPTSKTGAAVRKQTPTVVANLLAAMGNQPAPARYDGYTSCPIVTSRHRMLLAEFDYELNRTPTLPLINTMKPRLDMYLLKRYGLPPLYWHGMLKGRA